MEAPRSWPVSVVASLDRRRRVHPISAPRCHSIGGVPSRWEEQEREIVGLVWLRFPVRSQQRLFRNLIGHRHRR